MESKGALRLTLVTTDGEPLGGSVEIRLTSQSIKDSRTISSQADKPILIPDLPAFPLYIYKIDVVPAGGQPQSRNVTILAHKTTELRMVFERAKEPPATPVFQVDDVLTEPNLTARFRSALSGPNETQAGEMVVWQDAGDEVLVDLSTLQVRLVPPAVFAAIDLESDQTGRGTLIVRFVFGNDQDPAGLFATSDEVVRGHPQLAARWGPIFRELMWSALTRLSSDHAAERGLAPLQLSISDGKMQLRASRSMPLPDRVKQILKPRSKGSEQPEGQDL